MYIKRAGGRNIKIKKRKRTKQLARNPYDYLWRK